MSHAAAVVVLLGGLSGCAGYPGSYGQPGPYGSQGEYGSSGAAYGAQSVVGTVQNFDPGSGRLLLAAEGGYGGNVDVWLDRNTRLFLRGQQQDPAGLERGDHVRVEVQNDGQRAWARNIEVLQDVRESGSYGGAYGGGYGNSNGAGPYASTALEGAVRRVDTRRRMIELSPGGYNGQVQQVSYDERTRFDYRGQRVDPQQLEPGDAIRVDARRAGSGWIADAVWVTASVRGR